MALAIILLGTSPMPIGLTPGHLLNGINLQATKALRWSGLILSVHSIIYIVYIDNTVLWFLRIYIYI